MGSTFVCFLQRTDAWRDLSFLQSCLLETSRQVLKHYSPRGQRRHLGLASSRSGLMALPPVWHNSERGDDGSWIRCFDHHWMVDAGTLMLQNLSPYHQEGEEKNKTKKAFRRRNTVRTMRRDEVNITHPSAHHGYPRLESLVLRPATDGEVGQPSGFFIDTFMRSYTLQQIVGCIWKQLLGPVK